MRTPGDTSRSIIFCIPSVNGRMWDPNPPAVNKGMGVGLVGCPNPSICDMGMFPPEYRLLWPPPPPSPTPAPGAASLSLNLCGREVRLFTTSIQGMDDVVVTSSINEDGRRDSGGEVDGLLVALRGGWSEARLSLAVEYCTEG